MVSGIAGSFNCVEKKRGGVFAIANRENRESVNWRVVAECFVAYLSGYSYGTGFVRKLASQGLLAFLPLKFVFEPCERDLRIYE